MSEPKPTVMFLSFDDNDAFEENREVYTVPAVDEIIWANGERWRVWNREWQWDSSGRLRVVVQVTRYGVAEVDANTRETP